MVRYAYTPGPEVATQTKQGTQEVAQNTYPPQLCCGGQVRTGNKRS